MRAFEECWAEVEVVVRRVCRSYVGRYDEPDDLLQRVRIRAWRGHRSFRGDAPYLAWVCAIARNEARHQARLQARRRSREVSLESSASIETIPEATTEPPAADIEEGSSKLVVLLIAEAERAGVLSTIDAAILLQRVKANEKGWEDIGQAIGITAANAAQRHLRAIPKLRMFLFMVRPELLGGLDEVRRAFLECNRVSTSSKTSINSVNLTESEAKTFNKIILGDRKSVVYTPQLYAELRSACMKVIRFLPILI
jgi:RNA polymerase sigma factor (sigma-70 family)